MRRCFASAAPRRGFVGETGFPPRAGAGGGGGRMIIRKSQAEIETMARAGQIVAGTIALLEENVRPGVTTAKLDALAEEYIRSHGGEPTFKGYKGYPAATCLSPNDMVVHGIPNDSKLVDGDELSVDVGVTLDGFVADSAWTFPVGAISPAAQRLLATCQAALEAGIHAARGGNDGANISNAVPTLTQEDGLGLIRNP